ncbi:hypothetical protein [Shewanella sp. Isolate8]|uniref:hypothetical protein n=1 Tax=Shewanella sp. Isolate8 TaxID=2908529 RepID=UPI001EFD4343|nr:hypothetical protein [Shewanella sp. Isolate8]MCG9748338.1 hypothetical protein [Shewanella sp. Isolate8]
MKSIITTTILLFLAGCSLNYDKANSSYFGGEINSRSQGYAHYGYSERELGAGIYELFYVVPAHDSEQLPELIAKRAGELCRRLDVISFDEVELHSDIGADMPNTYMVFSQRAVVKCK